MGRYSAEKVSFAFFAFIILCIAFAVSPALAEEPGLSAEHTTGGTLAANARSGSSADNFIFTGAMTYSIPIEVPPGRLGMAPGITLTYNSQRRNGWLGMGWDLDIGSIRRDTSHGIDYDSEEFVYSKDGSSQALVNSPVSDCPSAGDIEFRAKIESGSFLKFCTDINHTSWTVYDKDGKEYSFGTDANSKKDNPADSSQVFQWNLDRVEEPNGNFMEITYWEDPNNQGEVYLDRIEYTRNDAASLDATYYVKLWLEDRDDAPPLYIPNFEVQTAKRLKTIEVGLIGGSTIRAYKLEYQYSASTAGSLLTSVQQFGDDVSVDQNGTITNESTASKLPALTFPQYSAGGTGVSNSIDGPSFWVSSNVDGAQVDIARVKYADFNGDGRTDIYHVNGWNSSSPDTVYLATENGFDLENPITGPSTWVTDQFQTAKMDIARIRFGDFNGDGKADVYRIDGWGDDPPVAGRIWLSTGSGFDLENPIDGPVIYVEFGYSQPVDIARVRLGDFNGDGKTDILENARHEHGCPWAFCGYTVHGQDIAYLSNGDGTYQEVPGVPTLYSPVTDQYDYGAVDNMRIKLGDFNGDGMTDIYRVHGWGSTSVDKVFLSNGEGFESQAVNGPATWVNSDWPYVKIDLARINFGDFNGDGKTDVYIVNGWGGASPDTVFLSTGSSTGSYFGEAIRDTDPPNTPYTPHTSVSSHTSRSFTDIGRVRFVDFNGDGKTDVYRVRGSGSSDPDRIWLSLGMGFQEEIDEGPATWVGSSDTAAGIDVSRIRHGDFNGDGMADVAVVNGWNTTRPMDIYYVAGEYPDLLQRYENGAGGTGTIGYEPSTNYQNSRLPFPVQTVSSITTDSGIVNSTTNYTYAYGYYDGVDREFRGFGYAKQTNPNGTTNETWFHQCNEDESCANPTDKDFKGMPDVTEFREPAPSETLISQTYTGWFRGGTPQDTYPVFVRPLVKVDWGFIEGGWWQTIEEYTHDTSNGFMNSVTTTAYTDDHIGEAETYTVKTDYVNKGDWLWRTALTNTTGSVSGRVREASFTYDSAGNLETKKDWNNEAQSENDHPFVQYSYNTAGLVNSVTDPLGNVKTNTYDATMTYPLTAAYPMTNGVSHELSSVYDNTFGQVKYAWDENGNKTENFFDPFGRIVNTVSYVGEGPEVAARAETLYFDDVFPRIVLSQVFDGTGYIKKYEYFDGLGRNIETITVGESAPVVTRTHYDEMGRAYLTDGPFFGNGFGYVQFPVGGYPWTLTTFNYLGMPLTIESPDEEYGSVTTTFTHSGLSTLAIDPDGKRRKVWKDTMGRVVEVKEYGDDNENYYTKYEYNPAGNLEHVRNYDQMYNEMHATHSTFNSLGQKRTMDDPVMGHWEYTYNLNGNLTGQTDAKGQVTTITYDELGRILTKSYSTGEPTVHYAYDDPSVQNGIGRLAGVSNTKVSMSMNEYDVMGRATSVTRTVEGAIPYTAQNAYDPAGRLESLTYPDGYRVDYAYHPGTDLIHTVTGSDEVVYATYTLYEPSGKIGQIDYANTTATRYTYDPWSTKLMGIIANSPEHGDVINRGFSYYPAGDMHIITDYRKGHDLQLPGDIFEYTYSYDDLHRLTGETTTNSIYDPMTYTYDSIGNIQSKQAGSTLMDYTYNATKKHMLDSVTVGANTYDFTYDSNGNMLTGYDLTNLADVASRQVSYSAENKPLQVVYTEGNKSKTIDFVYDGEGGRAKKILQGKGHSVSTTYYISRGYEITDGQPTKYIYAGGTKIASVSGITVYYFHQDHLGSTAAMTTDYGQPVESSNYFPYGGMREHWGTEVTNYKFTGQELDPETGLYYYGARYYDTALGRFISPDSIVPDPDDPQSFNRYAYALNNPLLYVDPNGHFILESILIGALMGGVNAAITDGDILEGMFIGAVSGALGGAVGTAAGHIVREATAMPAYMAMASIKASSVAALAGNTTAAAVVGGAVGGAVGGFTGAALSGGDIGRGALIGMITGGIAGAVGAINFPGDSPYLEGFAQLGTGAVVGGTISELSGGNFWDGATSGAIMGTVAFAANRIAQALHHQNTMNAEQKKAEGLAVDKGADLEAARNDPTSKQAVGGADTFQEFKNLAGTYGDETYGIRYRGDGGCTPDKCIRFNTFHVTKVGDTTYIHYDRINAVYHPLAHYLRDSLWQRLFNQ